MSAVKELVTELGIECPKQIDMDEFIVLIDDQIDVRLIVAHHLSKLGFKKIKQFSNGLEAKRWMENCHQKIAVTICDHEMPVMNGFDFVKEVEACTELRRGPFVIAIENPSRERIMLATECGVDAIVVKPYALKDIIPKLKQAFHGYHKPNNPELLYEAAKAALRKEEYTIARKIFEKLAQLNESAARPLVGMAKIDFYENRIEDGFRKLDEAEQRNPNYVHLFVARGEQLAKTGKLEDAVNAFKIAIKLSPLNAARYESCAEILFNLKSYAEAVAILNIALNNELTFPSLHHFLSQAFFHLKDYRRAVKHIRSALSLDENNITYMNQLGLCLKESGQTVEALQAYHSVIKLDPENQPALYNKAILLKQRGKIDEAIKQLEKLLAKFPEFNEARLKLEEFKNVQGATEEAG